MFLFFALLTLFGCSDYAVNELPEATYEDIVSASDLDVMVVLDTSCSMVEDWPIITYGLGVGMDDLASQATIAGRVTSACPDDDVLFPFEDGWTLVEQIPKVRLWGCGEEAGLEAALTKKDIDFTDGTPAWGWHWDSPDIVVFVSDEPDQSSITPDDFLDAWPPDWVVAVVGPDATPPDGCRYEEGTGYLELADQVVSVCTSERWTFF